MHQVLILAAAHHEQPLIDLDSTVFLQLGVFVITALVLRKWFFQPYLRVKAQRAAGIDGARREAAELEETARAHLSSYQGDLAKARQGASEERARLRAEAAARARELAEEARVRAHTSLEASREKLRAESEAARQTLGRRAAELARSLAGKILGREVT